MSCQNSVKVLGYDIYSSGLDECVRDIMRHLVDGEGLRWAACINPHSYVVASDDGAFRLALQGATWLLPDGVGIVMAARLLDLRNGIIGRITGPDLLMQLLLKWSESGGVRLFLLGTTQVNLEVMRRRIELECPRVAVVGIFSPPFVASFTEQQDREMVDLVNSSGANVLLVAMTAPKQEKWMLANSSRLQVKFAAAIGAAFDFYTGRVKRPARLWRALGLEWMPRLLSEPRRLWKRSFVSAPRFVLAVLRHRLTRRSGSAS